MTGRLPHDVMKYITSFLVSCECCNTYTVRASVSTCDTCKRSWCVRCDIDRYIGYSYFDTSLLTCRWCIRELRFPLFIN